MRHLVYRVQPLPQSLLPLVWDFGTLKCASTEKALQVGGPQQVDDVETAYITKMVVKWVSFCLDSRLSSRAPALTPLLSRLFSPAPPLVPLLSRPWQLWV